MSKKKAAIFLIGGGVISGAAAWLTSRKMRATTAPITAAVEAPPVALPPSADVVAHLPKFQARLTGYWPYSARADEKKMEGGVHDRLGAPIHTLEQHLSGSAPYVSVSGDPKIFPPGQRLIIDAWPNAIFRVVDVGSHFTGIHKLYRVVGAEPLDVAVDSSKTVVPKLASVQIVPGDFFASKKGLQDVAYSKFKDQTVAGEAIREGRTSGDHEALARAVQSELGDRSREEQVAAAWAIRNRAELVGASVQALLAPSGEYGSPQRSGGYASTRRAPSSAALAVADEVLGADASADPTGGAFDYWVPEAQRRMRQLGDVYRAARKSGDAARAQRYERFAGYSDEEAVRKQHRRDGLSAVAKVGAVELLGVG